MKKILIFIVMLLPFISEAQNDSGSLYMTAREFGLRQKRLVLSRVFLTPSLATPYDSANANIYYDTDIQAFLFRENGVWVRYGSTTYPAGNYGNVQLNRNGLFATPASDSFSVNGGVLTFKGAVQLGGSGYALGDFGQGHIYNTTVYGTVFRPKVGSSFLFTIQNDLDQQVIWTAASDMGVFFGQNIYMNSAGTAKLFFKSNESTDYMQQSAASNIKGFIGGVEAFNMRTGGVTVPEVTATEKVILSGDISPSQITSNQNNYAPTGFSAASVLRLNTDAARNITGLAGGADGRVIFIFNNGSFTITFKDEDANSTAANRFAFNADIEVKADEGMTIWYDATSSRWRTSGLAVVHTADNGLTMTNRNTQWGGRLIQNTTVSGINNYSITFDSTLFMVSGPSNDTGTEPISGAGTRMFFAPKRAAFRAGVVSSTQWDAANIGYYSIGLGNNAIASGIYSFAVQGGSQATGNTSIAMGDASIASGDFSFGAQGGNASGVSSFALGNNTFSSGVSSFSLGRYLKSKHYGGTVIGTFNDSTNATSPTTYNTANKAFQIGVGTADAARSNAMEVLFSGATKLNKYGVGTFGGTPTYGLGVDGSGNLVETSANVEGSYTPTHFLTTNIAATTSLTTYYIRVGDWVHVWGECDIDPTTSLIISELGISLPIATSITNTYELSGTGSYEDNTSVKIAGDVTNDRAKFRFIPQTSTNNRYSFHFSYKWVAP